MKFGLYVNPQTSGPEQDREIILAAIDAAVAADRAGFGSIWLTEHHFVNYNTYADSMLLAANLLGRMDQAWVVLTVATLALHNPIRFAEQCNVLDQLASGRFIAGYGSGGSSPEYAGFGRNPSNKHDLMAENLEIAEKAWALRPGQEPLEYKTAHESGRVVNRIMPTSYREGRPLLARGTLSEEGIIDTARRGHVLLMGRIRAEQAGEQLALYRSELEASGHAPELIETLIEHSGPARMLFVAETDDEAFEQMQDAIDGYLDFSNKSQPANRGERDVVGDVRVFSEKADLLDRAIIWGGPEKVTTELKKFEEAGLQTFAAWFSWGGMSNELAARSQRIFSEQVLPNFLGQPATVGVAS